MTRVPGDWTVKVVATAPIFVLKKLLTSQILTSAPHTESE